MRRTGEGLLALLVLVAWLGPASWLAFGSAGIDGAPTFSGDERAVIQAVGAAPAVPGTPIPGLIAPEECRPVAAGITRFLVSPGDARSPSWSVLRLANLVLLGALAALTGATARTLNRSPLAGIVAMILLLTHPLAMAALPRVEAQPVLLAALFAQASILLAVAAARQPGFFRPLGTVVLATAFAALAHLSHDSALGLFLGAGASVWAAAPERRGLAAGIAVPPLLLGALWLLLWTGSTGRSLIELLPDPRAGGARDFLAMLASGRGFAALAAIAVLTLVGLARRATPAGRAVLAGLAAAAGGLLPLLVLREAGGPGRDPIATGHFAVFAPGLSIALTGALGCVVNGTRPRARLAAGLALVLAVGGAFSGAALLAAGRHGAEIRERAMDRAATIAPELPDGGQVILVCGKRPIERSLTGSAHDALGADFPEAFAFRHPGLRHRALHVLPEMLRNPTPAALLAIGFRPDRDRVVQWKPRDGFEDLDIAARSRPSEDSAAAGKTLTWDFREGFQAHAWLATREWLAIADLPEWSGPDPDGVPRWWSAGPKDAALVGPALRTGEHGVPVRIGLEAWFLEETPADRVVAGKVAALGPDGAPLWHAPLPPLGPPGSPPLEVALAGLPEALPAGDTVYRLALVPAGPKAGFAIRSLTLGFEPRR